MQKCTLLMSYSNQKCNLSTDYNKNLTVSDLMKILVALLELLHADRRKRPSEQAHLLQIFVMNVAEIPIIMLVGVEMRR
jgi:hypothetical protein